MLWGIHHHACVLTKKLCLSIFFRIQPTIEQIRNQKMETIMNMSRLTHGTKLTITKGMIPVCSEEEAPTNKRRKEDGFHNWMHVWHKV